jgi:hypothetical protein
MKFICKMAVRPHEDSMYQTNVFEITKNTLDCIPNDYKHQTHFGTIIVEHQSDKFELYDDMWSIYFGILDALLAAENSGEGYSTLDLNYTEALLYKSTIDKNIKWFHIVRRQGYPPRTVFEEKKFPFFSFIAAFLPVARAYLDYQITIDMILKNPFRESTITLWKDTANKVEDLLNANQQALSNEQFFEKISPKISTLHELSTRRPLLAREKFELATLEKLQKTDNLEQLEKLQTEVENEATDAQLKTQLLKSIEEKKGFY